MPNNIWESGTYRKLRQDILSDYIWESKVMAEIMIGNKDNK